MSASPEEMHIVRTVVNEFLPVLNSPQFAEKLFVIVMKCVEQETNQAPCRADLRKAILETGQEIDGDYLDLCIKTANNLIGGYGRWLGDQADVDEYPAWQLSDFYKHKESVDWLQRWRDCGGQVFPRNEMIALKHDPIWSSISLFGLPFPPFDLDSGMDVDGVSRRESEELGLLSPGQRIEPVTMDWNFGPALRQRIGEYLSQQAPDEENENEEE